MGRILIAEDEERIASFVRKGLSANGFTSTVVDSAGAAVDYALTGDFDLMVLDLGLPDADGFTVLRRLREEGCRLPILILTARDGVHDTVTGLEAGADDYMTKPFSMRELAARVHVLLRRMERAALAATTPRSGILRLGELEIDHAQRRVRVRSEDVHLTPTEFDLLVCLANTPRAVLSREQLLAEVWDWADASGTRTVDSHIKALRRKIGAERIRTVHGVGYALETPTP